MILHARCCLPRSKGAESICSCVVKIMQNVHNIKANNKPSENVAKNKNVETAATKKT
jgi:hypothetical protein